MRRTIECCTFLSTFLAPAVTLDKMCRQLRVVVLAGGLLLALGMAAGASECLHKFALEIEDDLEDAIHSTLEPAEDEVVDSASRECTKMKRVFGVAYSNYTTADEPDVNDLLLELKTKDSTKDYKLSEAADAIPRDMVIDSTHQLVIFLHGFIDQPSESSFTTISNSFFTEGTKYHILALNAHPLIHWLYLRSTTYVRFIGEKLGAVLAALVQKGVDPANIHLIGHSLGAHIAGFAGKSFYSNTGRKVSRISGLDPAGPCFSNVVPEHRLKSTDAEFVDVMHTDAGVFGLKTPIGHVDYYPNSGSDQPNCLFQTCCHSRAWEYYAESIINAKAFPAIKCADWNAYKAGRCDREISYMGYPSKRSAKGLFYLQTGDETPYGLSAKGLTYEDKGASKPIVSRVISALRTLVDNWDKC